jgi:hypothetical protein
MAGKRARTRVASVSRRAHEWVDRQDPDSASGVAIGAWRRYRAVDGPLQSALLAIGGALFFGLGFGRVLQLVHVRAWQVRLPARQTDQALYAAVLVGFYGLILLLLVQLTELRGSPSWVGKVLAIGWVALLVVFFTWAPWPTQADPTGETCFPPQL